MRLPSPTLCLLPFFFLTLVQRPTFASIKPYVVYFGGHSHGPKPSSLDANLAKDSHYEFLGSFLGSREFAEDAIFYSYTRHINGFAATLEDEVAAEIASEKPLLLLLCLFPCFVSFVITELSSLSNAEHPRVVSVFLNQGRKQHTTHSWSFLGLEKDGVVPSSSIWKKARFGEDTIIGNLDTGARYFNKGYASIVGHLNSSFDTPRDEEGHGSHTLSTAGGSFVAGASVFYMGNGTAKGGSPKARVAAYKVCYPPVDGEECFDADILAAFDAAISDGVDVLSVSLGGNPTAFFNDSVAIGSFHAVKNGIVVICSAGNSGPVDGTVSNVAPWEITVGASTMDREFPSYVVLGNKISFKGESLSAKALPRNKFFPLMSAADARATNASVENALLCKDGSLDPEKAKGKILVCLRGIYARVDKGQQAALAGAVGMVLANNKDAGNEILADPHVLPVSHINYTSGVAIFKYINSTEYPVAYITHPVTRIGTKPAPVVAAFSSKGPNTVTPEILKISTFSDAPYECPSKPISLANFNYPSITVPNLNGSITLSRTVKNVGSPSTYKLRIRKPTGVSVSVEPKKLEFKKVGEEKAFTVTLKGKGKAAKDYVFGELIWSDNKHHVRSPIVVKWF
ncbi:hypothetical protein POTOM_048742 [Populus tomentosa]|uniref:Subtilisin-like protease SBT5.3 n=1 Tax=Populus tomentosa TaxID=118781 RepID=A0A8X8C4V6_POPTO|nr:hypothetical protein POTOM_048742 [Populus tomentosa]